VHGWNYLLIMVTDDVLDIVAQTLSSRQCIDKLSCRNRLKAPRKGHVEKLGTGTRKNRVHQLVNVVRVKMTYELVLSILGYICTEVLNGFTNCFGRCLVHSGIQLADMISDGEICQQEANSPGKQYGIASPEGFSPICLEQLVEQLWQAPFRPK
jgi:hypothetical protein